MISAVVFSVGVALPGINNIPPGERFWLFLVGGLWGVLGAIISLGWQLLKKNPALEVVKPPVQADLRSNLGVIDPLRSNMSLESGHFQFAVSFAVIGVIGLFIAQERPDEGLLGFDNGMCFTPPLRHLSYVQLYSYAYY